MCDKSNAICIIKNTLQRSRIKQIEVHHHFILDHVGKGNVALSFVLMEQELADIFTKPFKP